MELAPMMGCRMKKEQRSDSSTRMTAAPLSNCPQ